MPPPSALTIEELEGDKRKLVLVGPGLPFKGAEWATEQRVVTKWYPKNREATQQVLGTVEQSSQWGGVWRTTQLLGSPATFFSGATSSAIQIVQAWTLHETIDSIANGQKLLRVTWSADEARTKVRLGRIQLYRPAFDTVNDIRWSLTFEWVSRGEQQSRVYSPKDESLDASLNKINQTLANLTSAIESAKIRAANADVPEAVSSFTLGDLEALANAPKEFLDSISRQARLVSDRVQRIDALVKQVTSLPESLVTQSVALATSTQETAVSAIRLAGRLPFELTVSTVGSVGAAMRSYAYSGRAMRAVGDVAQAAAELRIAASRKATTIGKVGGSNPIAPSNVITVVLARAGDTFVSLSRNYYGSGDNAAAIAKANRLPSYQVSPPVGMQVIIPRLTAQGAPRTV